MYFKVHSKVVIYFFLILNEDFITHRKLYKFNLIFSSIKSSPFLKEKSISKEAKIDRQLSIIDVDVQIGQQRGSGNEESRNSRVISRFLRALFLRKRLYWSEATKVGHCLLYRYTRKKDGPRGAWRSNFFFSRKHRTCRGDIGEDGWGWIVYVRLLESSLVLLRYAT